jgi:hypothetical protein
MRAMRDELARSMKKLQLENLQKPYFIAYRAVETSNCTTGASFGALINSNCEPITGRANFRQLSVKARRRLRSRQHEFLGAASRRRRRAAHPGASRSKRSRG